MKIWTRKNLAEFLSQNNVDISTWGKGEAKTFEHLFNELIKGECELYARNGEVVRKVEALSIDVFYKDEQLKEEYQKFSDGRIRRRVMDCSVAEKISKEDKSLIDGVKRAIAEELRIKTITEDQIKELPKLDRTRKSGSYPGTIMDITMYKFDIELTFDQYHPYGYVEEQEDKTTYFIWIQKKNIKNFESKRLK